MKTTLAAILSLTGFSVLVACEDPCPTVWVAREQTGSQSERLPVEAPRNQHSFTVEASFPVDVVVAGQITWKTNAPRAPLIRLRLTNNDYPASTQKVIDVPNPNEQPEAVDLNDANWIIAADRSKAGFTDIASTPNRSRAFAIALPNFHCEEKGSCRKRAYTFAFERVVDDLMVDDSVQIDWHVEAFSVIDYDACPFDDRRSVSLPSDQRITLRVE